MNVPIAAVYEGGVLRPAVPIDLPDGTPVRVLVVPATPPPVSPPLWLDPDAVRARLKRIADMPDEPGGDPTITGRDHDRALYGGPGGAR